MKADRETPSINPKEILFATFNDGVRCSLSFVDDEAKEEHPEGTPGRTLGYDAHEIDEKLDKAYEALDDPETVNDAFWRGLLYGVKLRSVQDKSEEQIEPPELDQEETLHLLYRDHTIATIREKDSLVSQLQAKIALLQFRSGQGEMGVLRDEEARKIANIRNRSMELANSEENIFNDQDSSKNS